MTEIGKNKLGLSCAKLSTAEACYPIARAAYSASCGWGWKLGLAAAKNLLTLMDEIAQTATAGLELAVH